MADLKLKKISLRHWMKFGSVEVEFPDKGLVMVTGHNKASGGALLSVGSGKTGFGEAISRTLLGVPGRFQHVRQYSSDKKGDTYVRVEALLHDKPLVVELGYKCKELSKSGEALRFHYDGKQIERGLIQETRDELVRLLGVSPTLAAWTVFVDGDAIKFNKLGQGDSVELVMAALRQPPWNEYHETSKKAVGRFRQTLAKDSSAHTEAQRQLRDAQEDMDAAREDFDEEQKQYNEQKAKNDLVLETLVNAVDTKNKAIGDFQKRQKELAGKIKKIENEKSEANHKLEIRQYEIEEHIQTLEGKRAEWTEVREKALQEHLQAKGAFENYKNSSKVCPTCKRPMSEKLDPVRLESLQESASQFEKGYGDAKAQSERNEAAIAEKNKQLRVVQTEMDQLAVQKDVTALSDEYADLDDRTTETQREVHRHELEIERVKAGVSDEALNQAKTTLVERKRVREKASVGVAETAKTLAESNATLEVLEYWNTAFSPYGIPNMVLKDAIAPLNKEARRISAAMTGGTIDVNYSTRRELATGAEKAELLIEVDNKLGSAELAGSSKGEAGLTNLIVAETLSEVGQVAKRIGYKWLDEVVPHQDQVVCQSIYARLREIADRFGILVFIVDHNPVAANYADHLLVVEKIADESGVRGTIHWR